MEAKSWMAKNKLKLNDSKTEFIIFGTDHNTAKVSEWTVSVGDTEILPSRTVRDIGAMLDMGITMRHMSVVSYNPVISKFGPFQKFGNI